MVVVGKKSAPSRISSDEGVVGEWRAVGVKQMVVVTEKATRGGECLMGGGGGRKCDGGWWVANRGWWVSNEGCGGQKSDGCGGLNEVSNGGWWWPKKSPSVSHFERGRGGVCREEDVGGQQNPSVSHSSARRVVRIERWWWCQTDGGGGQKSPSVLHLNEEGVVVGKRAPPSRVRATIPPPLHRVGSVALATLAVVVVWVERDSRCHNGKGDPLRHVAPAQVSSKGGVCGGRDSPPSRVSSEGWPRGVSGGRDSLPSLEMRGMVGNCWSAG